MSAFQLVIPKNQCYNLAMNKQNPTNYSLKKFDLFSSLLAIVNDAASNSEINRIIAEYLLRNFHKLHQLTIYDVAEECFVSRSSIHRFLKQIGFDQFHSLEQYVDETLQHYKAYLEYTNHDNFAVYIKKAIDDMMEDISQAADTPPIEELVHMLHDYHNIYILIADTSSSAAYHFQEELLAINKFIYVFTSSKINLDALAKLTKDDLLIVCSITGNYAFAVTEDLKDISATKVLITLNHTEKMQGHYDKIIFMGNQSYITNHIYCGNRTVYTKYGLLFFFDIIYNKYVHAFAEEKLFNTK